MSEVVGKIDIVQNDGRLQELRHRKQIQLGKITHEDRIRPEELAHRVGRIAGRQRPKITPGDINQFMEHETMAAEERLNIAEQRLSAIDLQELDLGFDDDGLGQLLHAVFKNHEFGTLDIELGVIDQRTILDIV